MDTTLTKHFGGVELEDVFPALLRSKHALMRLRKHLGPEFAAGLVTLPMGDMPQGDLRDRIHDFFLDEITNESKQVWSGMLVDPEDDDNPERRFPISIHEYEGVFYISALEYEPMGYFQRRSDAESCMHANWDNIRSDRDAPTIVTLACPSKRK